MVGCEYRKLWKSLEAITETALENTSAMVVITSGYSTQEKKKTSSNNNGQHLLITCCVPHTMP